MGLRDKFRTRNEEVSIYNHSEIFKIKLTKIYTKNVYLYLLFELGSFGAFILLQNNH